MLRFGHYAILVIACLGFVEKLVYMLCVGSWGEMPSVDPELLIAAFWFIGANSASFLPFLLFARKPYQRLWLLLLDAVLLILMLMVSLGTDWEMETGTDAQTGLVYIVAPVLQWSLVGVPILVHAVLALPDRSARAQNAGISAS